MDRGGLKEPEIVEFEKVKCAQFDGTSRLKPQDNDLLKSLTIWTIQAWIYPTKVGTNYGGNSHVLSNAIIGVTVSDVYFRLSSATGGDLCGVDVPLPFPIFNAWHHIKLTSNGTFIYLYIDGEEIKKIPRGSIGFHQNGFTAGGENGSGTVDANFYGYMTQFEFSDEYNKRDLLLTNSKFIYINKNNEVWAMV